MCIRNNYIRNNNRFPLKKIYLRLFSVFICNGSHDKTLLYFVELNLPQNVINIVLYTVYILLCR